MSFPINNFWSGVLARRPGHWLLALCIVAFSTRLAAQEWELLPSVIPKPRDEHASCVIDQHIYILGGAIEEGASALPDNHRYDTVNDTWVELAPMPTARQNHAAVATGGKCYVIGGQDGLGPLIAVLEIYDPLSDNWSSGADLPFGRQAHGAVAIEGLIYVVGGTAGPFRNELEVYNPQTDSWASLSPMPTARGFGDAAAMGGKLYVAGGSNGGLSDYLDVLEVYDPSSDQWSTLAPIPEALYYNAVAVSGTELYVTGGIGESGTVANTHVYDSATDTWSAGPSLTRIRNRHVMEKVGSRLFVLGGAESISTIPHLTTDTVEALEVDSDFAINAGLNDAWVSDQAPFQGMFITVFENLGAVFVSWFSFDSDGPTPDTAIFGASDQRWVTGLGVIDGDTVVISAELTSGGIFNASEPLAMQQTNYGTITIVFLGCKEAMVTYDFPSAGQSGQMTIHRVLEDNVALCEALTLP